MLLRSAHRIVIAFLSGCVLIMCFVYYRILVGLLGQALLWKADIHKSEDGGD